MKKNLLLGALLFLALNVSAIDEAEVRSMYNDDGCDDVCSSLALKELCARQIKARYGQFKDLCVQKLKSESICAKNLGVTEQACLNQVCATNLNTTTLCVTGTARLGEICSAYGASADFSSSSPYTLGTPVNFNNIIDDPNGSIAMAPFRYNVPVTGYYLSSIQIDIRDLMGADVILGVPVSNIQLKVNGVKYRQSFQPFLTFNNSQFADLSFLLLLHQGDIVTVEYDVLVMTQTGLTPYVGSVTIIGGPTHTIFNISYIASLCSPANCTPCTVCHPCDLDCKPFTPSCVPRV